MDKDQSHKETLYIRVHSPEKVFFEGEAKAVTSVNEKGRFDILPFHANFITIVREVLTIHSHNGQSQEIKIDSGIIRASENKLNIFLGIEALKEEGLEAKPVESLTQKH